MSMLEQHTPENKDIKEKDEFKILQEQQPK